MAKVFFTKEKPDRELGKLEYLIEMPTFVEEIFTCKRFEAYSARGLTTAGHLRSILQEIADKYNPLFNPMIIPVSNYEGIAYKTDKELGAIVTKIIENHSPETILGWIKHRIVVRPKDVRVIYMVSPDNRLIAGVLHQKAYQKLIKITCTKSLILRLATILLAM